MMPLAIGHRRPRRHLAGRESGGWRPRPIWPLLPMSTVLLFVGTFVLVWPA
jgi:hypothetical protein